MHCIVMYNIVLYCIVLYSVALYCNVQYCTVFYCTVQCSLVTAQHSYRAATGAMISLRKKDNHSSKEMAPSPFSSILAKQASLSSAVWKGAGRPVLFCAAVATLSMVANSEPETCPSLSASAAWKHFQLNQ